jgi:hypothetical protein
MGEEIRSFRQWKAEVMLWLSQLNNIDNVDAKRLVLILSQKLARARKFELTFIISRLTTLKMLGVPVPPEIFPTKEELEAWGIKDREPTKPPST